MSDNKRIILAVFVVSCALLLLEITLTRVFSVLFFYYTAFSVLSIALLGISSSGVFIYLFPGIFRKEKINSRLYQFSILFSISSAAELIIIKEINLPLEIQFRFLSLPFISGFFMTALVSFLPFLFSGFAVSLILTHYSKEIGKVYGSSFLGSGLGCILSVVILQISGGSGSITAVSLLSAAASFLFLEKKNARIIFSVLLFAGTLALMIINGTSSYFQPGSAKSVDNPVEFRKWNSFSYVAVAGKYQWDRGLSPLYLKENPDLHLDQKVILIDNFAYAPIVGFNGDYSKVRYLMAEVNSLPYNLKADGRAAIIGPGGGRDVLSALTAGWRDITGIEINPLIVNDVMQDKYIGYSGGIYKLPGVNIFVDEGRSFLRRNGGKYDLIMANSVETWAATASGAMSLTENYLYTREAFKEYLSRLTDNGMINVALWDSRNLSRTARMILLFSASSGDLGIGDTASRIAVLGLRSKSLDEDFVNVLYKKFPFSGREKAFISGFAKKYGFYEIYLPGKSSNFPLIKKVFSSGNAAELYKGGDFNLEPPTDNKPYFFFTFKPLAFFNSDVLKGESYNTAYFFLFLILAAMTVFAAVFIFLPLAFSGKVKNTPYNLLFFSLIGLAYMILEVALLQKFSLYLVHPVYSFVIVLFSMMVFGGLGSFLTQKETGRSALSRLRRILFLAVLIIGTMIFVMDYIMKPLMDSSFVLRAFASIFVLMPLTMALGMPLPLGIKILREHSEGSIPWMWGINGAFSVIGTLLAVMLLINFGFTAVFAVCIGLYFIALLTAGKLK
ncbi:MAG: hypothetical protein M1536_02380 [Firmicutes bacterium]|nr:hypothetical protein [Bacillota bacterium]